MRPENGCSVYFRKAALLFLFVFAACAGRGMASDFGGMKGLTIDGGLTDNIKEDGEIVGVIIRNYAILTVNGVKISCRNMVFRRDTMEVYAEGDVEFDDPSGSSFYCDRLFFNVNTWKGIALKARLKAESKEVELEKKSRIDEMAIGVEARSSSQITGMAKGIRRIFVTADEIRSISRDKQQAVNATLSPSGFANPHMGIFSKGVTFIRGEKVESWHNFLYIGKVPVMYFPYIIKDLKYDWPWLQVSGGYSEDWGAQAFVRYGVEFDPDPKKMFRLEKLFFDVDYRENRGMGYGIEAKYQTGRSPSYGRFYGYHINESWISRSEDLARAEDKNESRDYRGLPDWKPDLYRDEDRGMIKWEHYQWFNDNWDLRMEAHYISDRDFWDEYHEDESKTEKEPETGFDLRYQNDLFVAELVASKRINTWQTQSEYLPELRLNVPMLKVLNSSFYVNSETRIGLVNRQFDNLLDKYNQTLDNEFRKVKSGNDYDQIFRAYNQTVVKAPIDFGPLVVTPWVGGRAVYYDSHYGENGDGYSDGATNGAFLWGTDVSTRIYGELLGGRFRHIIEPTLSYESRGGSNYEPDELYYIDDLEGYHNQHMWSMRLHQMLQHRNKSGAYRDVAQLDLNMNYFPRPDEADEWNRSRHSTELEFNFTVWPTEYLSMWMSALYDTHEYKTDRLSVGADWRFHDRFRIYLNHVYYPESPLYYPTMEAIRQTTVAFRTLLWDKNSNYSMELAFIYDHESNSESLNGFAERRLTLTRNFGDIFEISASVIQDKKADENAFYVNVRPIGWAGVDRGGVRDSSQYRSAPSRYGKTSAMIMDDEEAVVKQKDAPQMEKVGREGNEKTEDK